MNGATCPDAREATVRERLAVPAPGSVEQVNPASPAVVTLSNRVERLTRNRASDDPELRQARSALAIARTDPVIREAIDRAPPLSPATISHLRALLPPVEARSIEPEAVTDE